MVSMPSQTSLSQVWMYIQIFIPLKASFFWRGIQQSIQQFNYCSKTSKVVGTQEVDTENHIGFLRFLSKSLENTCKRVHFWQCCKLYASSFTKKKLFLRHFSRILPIDSVGRIIEQLFWRDIFSQNTSERRVLLVEDLEPSQRILLSSLWHYLSVES